MQKRVYKLRCATPFFAPVGGLFREAPQFTPFFVFVAWAGLRFARRYSCPPKPPIKCSTTFRALQRGAAARRSMPALRVAGARLVSRFLCFLQYLTEKTKTRATRSVLRTYLATLPLVASLAKCPSRPLAPAVVPFLLFGGLAGGWLIYLYSVCQAMTKKKIKKFS